MAEQLARGITLMLPSEDALWVGEELTRRFGVSRWQFALTATDANRFTIRLARLVTGRPKVLVFNWCYHGTVDETFATLAGDAVVEREGNLGPPVPLDETTRVVEWNDVEALERELAHGDVACVLAEPALTNIGIVHAEPGFHDALRSLTRKYGTLLVIDETHTLCAGPGGFTAAHGLDPDVVTVGKAIGSGIPSAAYGFTEEVAARIDAAIGVDDSDVGGVGGTLAANVLSLTAMRATLTHVLTDEAFERMIALGERFERGRRVRDRRSLAAVARHAPRLPRRVPLPARAAAQRQRGGGRPGSPARPAHPPLCAEPRRAADAVPQHGADVAGDVGGRRRPAHRGVRGRRRRAHGLVVAGACSKTRFSVERPRLGASGGHGWPPA